MDAHAMSLAVAAYEYEQRGDSTRITGSGLGKIFFKTTPGTEEYAEVELHAYRDGSFGAVIAIRHPEGDFVLSEDPYADKYHASPAYILDMIERALGVLY